MWTKKIIIFLTLIIAFGIAFAKVPAKTLEEMVSNADVIVIGRTISIDADPHSDTSISCGDDAVYIITIKIKEIIKGEIKNTEELIISFHFLITISPIFQVGDLSILFLKKENNTFKVINGYIGKLDIEESTQIIRYSLISDQPERESVRSFLNKITNINKPY